MLLFEKQNRVPKPQDDDNLVWIMYQKYYKKNNYIPNLSSVMINI